MAQNDDTRKPVGIEELREWARNSDWQDELGRGVGTRGRVPTRLISDYEKKHRSKRYVPGYRPEVSGNTSANKSKAVATRADSAPKATAKTTAAPAAEKPVKVRSDRADSAPAQAVSPEGHDGGIMSVADAIAMLQSAASARKGNGSPALITIQTLVNV